MVGKTGARNLRIYGPILWLALAASIVLVIPKTGASGPPGLLCLSIVGLVPLWIGPCSPVVSGGRTSGLLASELLQRFCERRVVGDIQTGLRSVNLPH